MPNYKKKRYSKKPKVAKAIKQYVAKKIDNAIEDKLMISDLNSECASISSTAWDYTYPCNPAQGTSANTRIGRRIKIKSIEIDGWLSAGDSYNLMRIVLLKCDNTDALASHTLTSYISTDSNSSGAIMQVYYDKVHKLRYVPVDGSTATVMPDYKHIRIKRKFKNFTVMYGDNGTTQYNHTLCFACLSDSGTPPNPGFINGRIVCRYEDA